MTQTYYKNAIWTNHALQRLHDRGLSQKTAWLAFQYPDKQSVDRHKGTFEYSKTIDGSVVTVVCKQNEKKEWIILSCWADTRYPTTNHRSSPDGGVGSFFALLKKLLFNR